MTDINLIRAIIGHNLRQQVKAESRERTRELLANYYTHNNPGKRFAIDEEIRRGAQTDEYIFTIAPLEDYHEDPG